MLGVDPDHRKKGVGKQVLVTGLSYLKDKGIDVVELTTDSENEAARRLYYSMGFQEQSVTKWYEKELG
jgi:ribosomal protein S18 acetylase RimI-like enzyme